LVPAARKNSLTGCVAFPPAGKGLAVGLVFAGVEEVEESAPVGTARILARSDSFLAFVPNTDTRMEKWVW